MSKTQNFRRALFLFPLPPQFLSGTPTQKKKNKKNEEATTGYGN